VALNPKQRTAVGGLVLAASTLVGLALSEGYSDRAVIPVPGDRPTTGFGTTFRADGSPVQITDKTTPPRALVDLLRDAGKFERAVKRCAPVPMYDYEFSAYVQFTYNVGEGAFCSSTLAKKLNALDYSGACQELLRWDRVQGRTVRGLTIRRQAEHQECIGAKQ
jgi:lysozyme